MGVGHQRLRGTPTLGPTSAPSAGRWSKISSISRMRWRAATRSPRAAYALASCSLDRTARKGMTNVHAGRARIARVICWSAPSTSPRCMASRRRDREGEHAHRVVVHAVLVDNRQGAFDRVRSPRPNVRIPSPAAQARPHRRRPCRCCRVLRRASTPRRTGPQPGHRSPAKRCACAASRSAVSRQGLHDGSWAKREVSVDHHLLGSRGTHDGPQHGPRGLERGRTVQRDLVERRVVGYRRPPFRRRGVAGQRIDPACKHRERRIALDGGVAQSRQPPLHGGHLPLAVRG